VYFANGNHLFTESGMIRWTKLVVQEVNATTHGVSPG